jgi:hypothetical protein
MMTFRKLLTETTINQVEDISKDDIKVSESGLEVFKSQLDAINKKATKWGLPPVKFEIVKEETIQLPPKQSGDIPEFKKMYTLKVEGKSPQIPGYEFIAKIEHTEAGNIINVSPDSSVKDLPAEYRSADSKCDVCNTKRERFNTFIIKDEKENKLLTVGSSCLKRFLPIDSVSKLINYAEMLESLRELLEESGEEGGDRMRGGGGNHYELSTLMFYLCTAYLVVGKYISGKKAKEIADTTGDYVDSTAALARNIMFYIPSRSEQTPNYIKKAEEVREKANEMSKEVIDWMKNHDFKADAVAKPEMANYFNNLSVLSKSSVVNIKNLGYLGGGLISYLIEKEMIRKQAEKAAKKPSEFVGTVGQKIGETIVTLLFQRQFAGAYGVTTLYSFEDSNNNRLAWWSSNDLGLTDKTQYKIIKATVKSQEISNYGGHKETTITRVKLQDMDGSPINEEIDLSEYSSYFK